MQIIDAKIIWQENNKKNNNNEKTLKNVIRNSEHFQIIFNSVIFYVSIKLQEGKVQKRV